MSTDVADAIQNRPGGDTQAQLIAAYGDPGAGSRPDPRTRGWFIPDPAWEAANLIGIPTRELPGFPPFGAERVTKIKLHRLVAPVFRATWEELVRRGLSDKLRTYSGAFAPRHMGHDPTRPVSVHAYGAAIDFDAAWNGYGVPLERMQINREVVRCFEESGWHWGGRWTDPYEDGMHFQFTDSLSGVQVPAWQDALARPHVPADDAPVAAAVPVPAPPARRVMVNEGQGKWVNYDGKIITITGSDRVVINAKQSSEDLWIRYLKEE